MVGALDGGMGSLPTMAPIWPGGSVSWVSGSMMLISQPGTARVGDPGLTGRGSIPMQFAAIDQPVSVCHQWSMTGTFRVSSAHFRVSGSQRSPARNRTRNFDRSYFFSNSPFGSCCRIARKAVGAVNMVTTPCCSITRQKAPASGVPTGFPSYITEVAPCSSGP